MITQRRRMGSRRSSDTALVAAAARDACTLLAGRVARLHPADRRARSPARVRADSADEAARCGSGTPMLYGAGSLASLTDRSGPPPTFSFCRSEQFDGSGRGYPARLGAGRASRPCGGARARRRAVPTRRREADPAAAARSYRSREASARRHARRAGARVARAGRCPRRARCRAGPLSPRVLVARA